MSERKTIADVSKVFETSTSDITKAAILKGINIKNYLPIVEKRRIIEDIILKYLVEFLDARITYDSIDKMIIFMMSIVGNYTDLVAESIYSDFDCLMSSGLMSGILDAIGNDVDAYRDLFEMRLSDYIREHNSLEAVLAHKANELIVPLEKMLNGLSGILNNISTEDLIEIMKNAVGVSTE